MIKHKIYVRTGAILLFMVSLFQPQGFVVAAGLGGALTPIIEYRGPFEVLSGDTFRAAVMQANGNPLGEKNAALRLDGLNAFIRTLHADGRPLHQHCRNAKGVAYDCGEESFQALKKIFAENPDAICSTLGGQQIFLGKSVVLVACVTGSGKKIGAELVLQGWAMSDPVAYSNFWDQERSAQALGRGAHAGTYKDPSELMERPSEPAALFSSELAIQPAAIGTPDLPFAQGASAQ